MGKYTENNGESLLTCALAGGKEEIIDIACEDSSIFPGEGIYGESSSDFTGDVVATFGDLSLVKKFIKAKNWDEDTIERILQYVGRERKTDFFAEIWNLEEVDRIKNDQGRLIRLLSSGIGADTVKLILASLNEGLRMQMLPALRATYNTRESNCVIDLRPYIKTYYDFGIDFQKDSSIVFAAARNGEVKDLQDLLSYGANCNDLDLDFENETPLIEAVHIGDASVTRLLLEGGADPNVVNPAGETALMYALGSPMGSLECVKLLLQHGADVTITSSDGKSCIDLAKTWGDKEVVLLIQEAMKSSNKRTEFSTSKVD